MMRAFAVKLIGGSHAERPRLQIDLGDMTLDNLRPEPLRLGPQLCDQIRSHDAVAIPGPVLDHGRDHQLASRLEALDEQWLQIRAGGVDGRGEARRARADDDDVSRIHSLKNEGIRD